VLQGADDPPLGGGTPQRPIPGARSGGGDPYGPNPLNKMPATPGAKPPPPVVRPGWLNKNRDWIIPVECERDAVFIRTTNERIPLGKLSTGPDNQLLKSLNQLIDGRQKMVPPGVPPWRPIIRFEVHVDGSRAYFLAFPALDRLDCPKMRENLDLEDVRKKETGGK
jgi:hypothetical protein